MGTIYHIAFARDWARALEAGEYRPSTRGRTLEQEGFIHGCSTPAQVEHVANAFYAGDSELLVLLIDDARVRAAVRHEAVPGFDVPFPHLYGPLNPDAVIDTVPLEAGPDGRFRFSPGDAPW